MYNSVIYTLKC